MGGGDTAEEHVTWMLWAPTHPPTDKMASPFFVCLRLAILSFFIWEVYMFFLQLFLVFYVVYSDGSHGLGAHHHHH